MDGNLCKGCYEEKGTFKCGACKKAAYCSKKCQQRDWCLHIFDCTTDLPIKTFHHLARAVWKDTLPTDGETLEAWGFNRAAACMEPAVPGENYLGGVYAGLIKHLNVEPKTLDRWRQNGVLLAEIKKVYEAIPAGRRGEYYPWLLRNQYVLDFSLPLPEANALPLPGFLDDFIHRNGWPYAGDGRSLSTAKIKAITATWPQKQQSCFLHCSMTLSSIRPDPWMDNFRSFGFCVADDSLQRTMAGLYHALLRCVTFQQFCKAYSNGGIVALMREKLKIGERYVVSEEFEDIMNASGGAVPPKSVWRLKCWVDAQILADGENITMTPAVRLDYGFANCKNNRDRTTLFQIYRRYFESKGIKPRPLDLHKACVSGKLFEHLVLFPEVKLKEEHRRLLKNLYPLAIPDG